MYAYLSERENMVIYRPGSAMKASAFFAISDFLWCMSATVFTSPMVSPDICEWGLSFELFHWEKVYVKWHLEEGKLSIFEGRMMDSITSCGKRALGITLIQKEDEEICKLSYWNPKKNQGTNNVGKMKSTQEHGNLHWKQSERLNPLGLHFLHHIPNQSFSQPENQIEMIKGKNPKDANRWRRIYVHISP